MTHYHQHRRIKNRLVKFLLLCIVGPCHTVDAQIISPVHWRYGLKKTDAKECLVFIKGDIDEGWHIYSIAQKDGGSIKTSFTFRQSKDYDLIGRISEPMATTKYETAFGMDVSYFKSSVIFQQKIRLKTGVTTVKGSLKYMVCNDQKCLQPETVSFGIPIK